MKKHFALIQFILFLSFFSGTARANSYIGHNTIAIYIFAQLEKDPKFMPGINGENRKELIGKGIAKINGWDDLTSAQKALIHGVNFPDAFPLMDAMHQKMPQEILCAMYSLADKVPEVRKREESGNHSFIKKMQRYVTWGAKIHLAMDQIAHKDIPDPRTNLTEHIIVENARDLAMQQKLFQQLGFTGEKLGQMQGLAKKITPFDSENYDGSKASGPGFGLPHTLGNPGLDIRDEYVNLVLDYIKHGKDQKGKHIGDSLRKAENAVDFVKAQFGKTVPEKYGKMPGILEPTLEMINKIDPTTPPTEKEMAEQINLDDPAQPIIGRTADGKKLIERAR